MLDLAFFHHHDDVGECDRLKLSMGDVNEGDSKLALHAPQFCRICRELLVKRGQRLVEQEYPRLGDRWRAARRALLATDRLAGRRSASSVRRTFSSSGRRPCSAPPSDCPRTRSANAMLSRTVNAKQRIDWNIIGGSSLDRRQPATSSPRSRLTVGRLFVPAIIRRIVVLPQPEGPRKQQ